MTTKTTHVKEICNGRRTAVFSPEQKGKEISVRETAENRKSKYILITGGAGFIGTNLADRLLSRGEKVRIYDNLSRKGSEKNLLWLRESHPEGLQVDIADVRDSQALGKAVRNAKQVYHLAAQVAVTSSIDDPVHDFESNLRGTLNVLESLRAMPSPAPLLFTSTNKVYGPLDELRLKKNGTRYEPQDPRMRENGISERHHMTFHSPYGCSKGAADQYVTDYVRVYGLKAVVFRMSCIYGPRQFGTEDQGWIANFLIRALQGRQITVYGDGMQVRDVLYIGDLMDAFLLAQSHMEELSGEIFNIGGGARNTLSLLELLKIMDEVLPGRLPVRFSEWRLGDQRYYVTDHQKFSAATGWKPRVGVRKGIEILYKWLARSHPISSCLHLEGKLNEILPNKSQLEF